MGRIEVKGVLELDGGGWDRTINKAAHQTEHFANESLGELKGMIGAAFSVGAVEEFIRQEIEAVARIKDFSEQTQLSTDDVQLFQRAANRAGLEFENVATALSKFGKARKEAGEHEGEALAKLEKYGITLADVRNGALKNGDAFRLMGDALQSIALTEEGREDLREFFGSKGGDKMGAVLNQLAHMPKITLIDPEQIENIDRADKALKDLYANAKAMAANPISNLSQMLTGKNLEEKLMGYSRFMAENLSHLSPGGSQMIGIAKMEHDEILKAFPGLQKYLGLPTPAPAAGAEKPGGAKSDTAPTIFNYKESKALWEELHKAEQENREAGLTHSEKILQLEKDRLEIIQRMKGEKNDDLLKDQIKLVQLDTKLKEANLSHVHLGLKPGDSLTRTGNFLGHSSSSIVSIGEHTNRLLTQIRDRLPGHANGASGGNMNGTTSIPAM
ncbi:MAG: hypothetical protein JWQ04_2971 [Pedosphaera sp.]|nr:hypothetical protein [Pedosphaera sp.]